MATRRKPRKPIEKIYLLHPKTNEVLAVLDKELWRYGLWLRDGRIPDAAVDAMLLMGPEDFVGPDGRLPKIPRNAIPAPGFTKRDAVGDHLRKVERDRLKKLKERRKARAEAAAAAGKVVSPKRARKKPRAAASKRTVKG